MKTLKLAVLAAIAVTAVGAGAAQARPHGMRDCHMERHHHHMVRVCHMHR